MIKPFIRAFYTVIDIKTCISIILFIVSFGSLAQPSEPLKEKTCNKPSLSCFANGGIAYTQAKGHHTYTTFLQAGLLIDKQHEAGLFGENMGDNVLISQVYNGLNCYLKAGWGGLYYAKSFFSRHRLHFSISLQAGAGMAKYITQFEYPNYHKEKWIWQRLTVGRDAFFVLQPALDMDIRLFPFMKCSVGCAYRYIAGLKLVNTRNDALNKLNVMLKVKFGKYL